MSVVTIIRQMLAAGLSIDDALKAAEIMEANAAAASDGLATRRARDAERQRRHREKGRNVTSRDKRDSRDTPPLLSPPLPPAPPNTPPIIPPTGVHASDEARTPQAGARAPEGNLKAVDSASLADLQARFLASFPGICGDGVTQQLQALVDGGADPAEILRGVARISADWSPKAKRTARAETFLASDHWRDPKPKQASGGGSHTGNTWTGPPDVRGAVVLVKGEAFARSWLDPCAWEDGPVRAITTANGLAYERLNELNCLRAMGISVFDGSRRKTG